MTEIDEISIPEKTNYHSRGIEGPSINQLLQVFSLLPEIPGEGVIIGSVGRALAIASRQQNSRVLTGPDLSLHFQKNGILELDWVVFGLDPLTAKQKKDWLQRTNLVSEKKINLDLSHLQTDDFDNLVFARNPGQKITFSDLGFLDLQVNGISVRTFDLPTHFFFLSYPGHLRTKDFKNALKLFSFLSENEKNSTLVRQGIETILEYYLKTPGILPNFLKSVYYLIPQDVRGKIEIRKRLNLPPDPAITAYLSENQTKDKGEVTRV